MNNTKPNASWLKTFSIGFSIISFGITLAIIGYILTTSKNQTVNQQPTSPTILQPSPTPDLTANWKTYTNPNLKYAIKYPINLQLVVVERDFGGGYIVVVITDMKLAGRTTYPADSENLVPAAYTLDGGDPAIYKGFILDIRPVFNVNQNFDIMTATKNPPVRINNANVYKSSIDILKKNNFQGAFAYAVALNYSRNYRYDISWQFNADKKEYFPLFDQILSTFRFIE